MNIKTFGIVSIVILSLLVCVPTHAFEQRTMSHMHHSSTPSIPFAKLCNMVAGFVLATPFLLFFLFIACCISLFDQVLFITRKKPSLIIDNGVPSFFRIRHWIALKVVSPPQQ